MAGRGHGRGQPWSNVMEDMGLDRSDLQPQTSKGRGDGFGQPKLTPSPVYPPLKVKPLPLPPPTEDSEYLLTLFKLQLENAPKSRFWIRPEPKQPDIERYSDRYKPRQEPIPLDLDWSRFPPELRPGYDHRAEWRKRKAGIKVSSKAKKARLDGDAMQDVQKRLSDLENKENGEAEEGEERWDEDEEGKENNDDNEEEDDELDEGNDYARQYLDDDDDVDCGDDDGLGDGDYY